MLLLAYVSGDLPASFIIHSAHCGPFDLSVTDQLIVEMVVNAQSLGKKAEMMCRIIDEQLDILVISETWHEQSSSAVCALHRPVTAASTPHDPYRQTHALILSTSRTTVV